MNVLFVVSLCCYNNLLLLTSVMQEDRLLTRMSPLRAPALPGCHWARSITPKGSDTTIIRCRSGNPIPEVTATEPTHTSPGWEACVVWWHVDGPYPPTQSGKPCLHGSQFRFSLDSTQKTFILGNCSNAAKFARWPTYRHEGHCMPHGVTLHRVPLILLKNTILCNL